MRKILLFLLTLYFPTSLFAQGETIRGRVVADSGRSVFAADIWATRSGDRQTLVAHSDSSGHFSIHFDKGTGDYLVNVRAIGYKPFRKRFTRTGTDSVIVADITMQTEAVAIAPIVATATRNRPAREGAGIGTQQGSNEQLAGSGVNGALSPDQAGDINAIASTIPGMMLTPNGVSTLGLAPDQNSVQLNGMNFAGGSVPRDARTNTRVSTSTFDPARGGFTGAQISVDLAPGGIFSGRRAHLTVDAPQLQFGDAYARAFGEEYRSIGASIAADGEMKRDTWFYNVSFESKNRAADYASLLTADNSLFTLSGITPDSARRVVSALQSTGIPSFGGVPGSRNNNQYTFMGRVDRTPYGDKAFAISTYFSLAENNALGISPTVTPSLGGSTTAVTGMLQAIYSFYFGKNYLADTRSSITYRKNNGDPYVQAPSGRVLFPTASLGFGGNGNLVNEGRAFTWQSIADLQLYTKANRNKVRVRAESQLDLYDQQDPADLFGTYTYQSINDLINNKPATFTRTLQTRSVSGGMWSGVLAVGDNLRKNEKLNILYGARVEANRFTDRPNDNPAVTSAFGANTDEAPNRFHVSPRLGFSWKKDPKAGGRAGMSVSNLMTKYFSPSGILRGGIGEFRGQMSPRLLSDAMRATGLAGDVLQLQCVGSAVPLPTWDAFLSNPGLIPEQCANGAPPVFADASRSVTLFSPDYDAPRSWRANLGWSTNIKKTAVTLDATYALNVDQPGSYDLNFSGQQRGVLSGEGNRPLFVNPSSIVASTGAVSSVESRSNGAFGRVMERRSDLHSRAAQLNISVSPEFSNWKWYATGSYTLASARAQFRGFDGGAFGDPRAIETAASNFDARHQFTLQAGHVFKFADLTLRHTLTSGLPYTPIVDGDVNGDGIPGDRAFIFDNAAGKSCLADQVGRVAGRNSCRGPWTQTLNVRLAPAKKYINTGKKVNFYLNMSKTWNASPDPVLYRTRAFDAANQRFVYELNSRFGDARSRIRNPFRVTLDVSINLGRNIDVQQLDRYLKPGRTQPGEKMSADSMEKRYKRNVIDPYDDIMQESDSLLLSKEQIAQLKDAQKVYRARVDSLWHDLATYLAALPEHFNSAEALKRQEDAVDQAWEFTRLEGETVKRILTPLQMNLLGGTAKYVLTSKEKVHIRMYRN